MWNENELIRSCIGSFHFIAITVIFPILSDLSHNTMQAAEAALFKGFHMKSCVVAQLFYVLSAVDPYITLACKVNQRNFDMIANPAFHR